MRRCAPRRGRRGDRSTTPRRQSRREPSGQRGLDTAGEARPTRLGSRGRTDPEANRPPRRSPPRQAIPCESAARRTQRCSFLRVQRTQPSGERRRSRQEGQSRPAAESPTARPRGSRSTNRVVAQASRPISTAPSVQAIALSHRSTRSSLDPRCCIRGLPAVFEQRRHCGSRATGLAKLECPDDQDFRSGSANTQSGSSAARPGWATEGSLVADPTGLHRQRGRRRAAQWSTTLASLHVHQSRRWRFNAAGLTRGPQGFRLSLLSCGSALR